MKLVWYLAIVPLLFSCNDSFADSSVNPNKHEYWTTQQVIEKFGQKVRARVKPVFQAANVAYPPAELTFIGLKKEKLLLVFAKDRAGRTRRLLSYPVIGSSGVAGPKLKEGDLQVPEGFYRISRFRPNLVAYMGLELNYPNSEDRQHALKEKRKNLGGDILIHGSKWSTGCLAMGNPAIEELFVMTHDTGQEKVSVVIAPCNMLVEKPEVDYKKQPVWLPALYEHLQATLTKYPLTH